MASVISKAKHAIKQFFLEVYYFLTSGVFWKNFIAIIAVGLLLGFLTFKWLNCYTRHGQSLKVSDYIGMDIDEAQKTTEGESFELIVTDSVFMVDKRPGTVLEQNPKPGSSVKEGRKIYVRITKEQPEPRQLPGLAQGNDDVERYRKKLENIDVHLKVIDKEFNRILEEGTITEVFYKGKKITDRVYDKQGYKVNQTDTIEVVVSTRSAGRIPLVNLVCRNLDEARFVLSTHGLNVGDIIEDVDVYEQVSAYVYRQSPAYDTAATIEVGGSVDLFIRQAKPIGCN